MSAVDPVRALKVADLAKQAAEKAKLAAFEEAATEARSEANSPIGDTLNGSAFSDSSAATGLQFGSLGPGRKAQFAVPFQMPEIALVSPASLQQDESETDGPANVAPANYASEPAPETSELESDEPTFEELNSPEQQALKELLEDARADLTSEDPETIKQAEIVIAYAEAELWQAEAARLNELAQQQAQEIEAALGEDSVGEAGAAPDSCVVPDDYVLVEGEFVDPDAAEALIAQQLADARAAEAQAQADAASARLAQYIADPNYAAAESAAEAVINAEPDALRAAGIPEGMVVDFSPTDTSAEAEERQEIAEAAADAAAEALAEAERAAAALEAAADAPEADRGDLYAEAGEHSAAAGRQLSDAQVALLELTIEDQEAYVETLGEGTEERTEAETTLENLETLLENLTAAQEVAPANERLAEEWGELVTAEGREEQFFDIGENIIEYLREDPDYDQYFRAEGFNELDHNGRASLPTGEREGYEFVERDGQLYLSIDYANRDEPLEIQLTYASGQAPEWRSEALLEFDQQWGELTGGLSGSLDSHSRAGLNGAIDASNTALEEFYLAQADQQTSIADQLAGPAAEAAEALEDAREQYGDGTLVAGGETPVQIQINPDLNLDGLELDLSDFDLADLDGRWVHPDVANAWSTLSDALARIQQGEDLQERTVALFLEEHSPDYFGLPQDDWEVTANDIIEEGGVVEQDGNLYLDPSVLDGSGILDTQDQVQLTFEPDDPNSDWLARSDAAQRLDQEWADFQAANEGDGLESARETLTQASDDLTASLVQFGSGTTEELTGTLPEGVEPVLVPIDGEQRFVHPDVAEALFTLLDLQLQLDQVNLTREQALDAADQAAFQLTQPSLLPGGGSAAECQQELQEAWDHEDTDNGVNDALDRLADSMDDRNTAQTSALRAEGAGLEAEHPELAPLHDLIAAGDGDDLLTGDNLAPEIERLLETETGQAWQAAFQELDRLGGEREEITNIRAEAEADRDWKDFLLQVPLEERRNPDNWLELESLFVEQNLDAAARTLADRQSQLPEQVTIDDKLEEAIGIALGTDDRSVIDPVADQIRTIGDEGDNVEVSLLTYSDNGVRPAATFQVESSTGTSWLVFEDGAKYRDLEDLQKNGLLSENGQLYVPRVLSEPGAGEEAGYEWVQAADGRTTTEQIAEPLVGLVTGIATGLAILVPVTAPVTATVAFAGGAYLGWGSLDRLDNMRDHGRSLLSTEGLMEGAMVVTTVLPMASSAFRFLGLARAGMATEASLAASIGAVNESLAADAALLSANGDPLFSVARWLDGGAIFSGAPLLSYSWYYVMANAGYMPVLDLANGLVSAGIGAFGTGMGYRGFRDTRPGQTMQLTDPSGQPITAQLVGGARPTGPDDVFIPFHTPDTGQRFQFVRDDTGAYVIPWMREPWRQSPQSKNAAPRPAQHDNGVPIVTRENPANHVRPEQDEPAPAPSPHYSQLPKGGTGDLFLVGNDLGRSSPYATLPPRYTGDLSYTSGSGSEPRWPSYLFEQRTSETLFRDSDPAKARADEYQRYLRELPYHSAEEMALRYGPGGPTSPATAIRTILPDFRLGGAARVRLYGGDFGAGSPTMLSAGVGIGTKTNYPDLFWALLYSMAGRSPTVALNTFGQEAVVSLRPREYRNLTAKEAGLSPTSTQTAFPVRASELLPIGESSLFTNSSGYHPVLRKAAVVGRTPDGAASVVEVTYSMLIGGEVPLTPPQRDFFGVPAERAGGFVRLLGEVPFDRVMAEFKATLRPAVLASLVEAVATLPRFGLETRREAAVKDFLRPGDIISQPSFDQVQSTFGTGRLKVQFVVGDHRRASEFVAEVNKRNSDSIDVLREMVSNGLVDHATAVSFVRNPIQSGFRLSAIPGKPLFQLRTLPTGKREYLIDPKALLLDVIFNDHSRLLPSVDPMATSAGYRVKKALRSIMPPSLLPDTQPQPRYMPKGRKNIYGSLHVEDGATPATRYTVSAATPQLPVGRVALSGELRLQWKRPPKPIAPVVARDNRLPMSLTCSDGRTGTLEVPAWLAHTLEIAQDGAAAIIPKGARSSFDRFLGELEAQTDPVQHATIAQFRQGAGTAIQDAMFLRTPKADEVRAFLSQFVSRESVGETNPRSQESGPESLSAAYHPAGQPYPSAEPPLPATFRMQQTTPSNALPNSLLTPSGEPLRLMTTFPPPEVRQVPGSSRVSGPFGLVSGMSGVHLTSQTRSATASINPGELEAGLAALGVSPERARAFAAEVNNPNARETIVVSRTSGGSEEHDAAGGQIQPQPFGPRRLSSLSTDETAALSLGDIRGLTDEQVGQLTLPALTRRQVRALTAKQLYNMSPDQFRKFTPEQFGWLTPFQLDALSVEHLRIFRATHRKDLGPEQTASLKDALMRARWKEFRQSAATFVTMATSSYVLFSTAPSHWLATAAAVGFGLRGGIFLTQYVSPNATSINTGPGRWLNGVSGASYALTLPGGVAAALQGQNLLVNGTYTAGGVIFGVKSILQAATGRPQLRNLSERWGEGLFVAGSVPYTLQSIGSGSMLGAIGGAAFVYGCGYYMVRAARDDVVMRRPVPSTEMEIAAAEKSEARWARHDRDVLGIAFGGGMLAFSLDALLAQPWDVAETDDPDDLNPELRSPTEETQPPRHLGREIEPHSETPEQPQQPRQLGVLDDGSVDLQPATSTSEIKTRGSPVEETGERLTDHAGSEWKAVGQYGPNALDYAGSLSASLAEPRAEGIQNSEGRFNWELEEQGYNWVEARAGQSISSIARSRGVGVAETVMLNMNHIVDPSLVFSGDRIYIPQALSSSVLAQSQPARSKLLSAGAIRL